MRAPKTLLATLVGLLLVSAAGAGELFTATLNAQPGNPDIRFRCSIVNVGTRERVVRTLLTNAESGAVVADSGEVVLAPGLADFTLASVEGGALVGYCHFLVEGGRKQYRASACVLELGVGCVSAVAAD